MFSRLARPIWANLDSSRFARIAETLEPVSQSREGSGPGASLYDPVPSLAEGVEEGLEARGLYQEPEDLVLRPRIEAPEGRKGTLDDLQILGGRLRQDDFARFIREGEDEPPAPIEHRPYSSPHAVDPNPMPGPRLSASHAP